MFYFYKLNKSFIICNQVNMKKYLALFLFLNIISCSPKSILYTATDIPKIEFDFDRRDSIRIPNKIRQGEFYQLKITGINLNQYIVVLQNKDTVYSKPLEFPTFGSISLSNLTGLVNSLPVKSSIMNISEVQMAKNPKKDSINTDNLKNAENIVNKIRRQLDISENSYPSD